MRQSKFLYKFPRTNKWIQFSTYNKLRRKDPIQWKTCKTCNSLYIQDITIKYGGTIGNFVSIVLDNPVLIKIILSFIVVTLTSILQLQNLLSRILVSKIFWLKWSSWSKVTHLPFVLQLWGIRVLLMQAFSYYLELEKKIILVLADLETSIVEPKLPII